MPVTKLREESKLILNELGKSLARAFSPVGVEDDESITALLERLDELNISREFALDNAIERTSRLLANTANQTVNA